MNDMDDSGRMSSLRLVYAVLFVLVTLFGFAPLAWSQAGYVHDIQGQASIEAADGTATPAVAGSLLQPGATISTSQGAEVTLKFSDGEVVRLLPGASIVLRQYQFNPQNLSSSISEIAVITGAVRFVSGAIALGNPGGMRIGVGDSVVRRGQGGADLVVTADGQGTGTGSVAVVSGSVSIGTSVVAQGQFAAVLDAQTIRAPVPIIAAPAAIQATTAALTSATLPDATAVVVSSAARAAAARALAAQAQAAAAASPENPQLQTAAQVASLEAAAATQLANAQSATFNATVLASVIAVLPASAAGPPAENLAILFNATPPVTGCVGSPC